MDSTIRLWKLPSRDHDPYAPYDPSTSIQTLEGHTDIVWDLCLLPPRPDRANGSAKRTGTETQLISVSADGTAKVWEERDGRWALTATFSDFGPGVVPTCLSVDNHDFGRVLVGLSNGLLKVYNVDSGTEVQSFGEPGSQVNAVICHPTLPLIITGHEDGHLRFLDLKSCKSNICFGTDNSVIDTQPPSTSCADHLTRTVTALPYVRSQCERRLLCPTLGLAAQNIVARPLRPSTAF